MVGVELVSTLFGETSIKHIYCWNYLTRLITREIVNQSRFWQDMVDLLAVHFIYF